MITYKHIRNLDSSQTENGAIFTCGGFSVLLIWVRNRVFLFDSHCRNVEGFPDSNGSAILLEFRLILSPNNLIKRFYHVNVTIHFFSCITCNQNVKINIYAENISNIQTALNRQRNSYYYYQSKRRNNDIGFEIVVNAKFEKCKQDEGNNI